MSLLNFQKLCSPKTHYREWYSKINKNRFLNKMKKELEHFWSAKYKFLLHSPQNFNHVGFRAALPTFKKKRRGKKLGIYELLDLVSVWTDAKKVGLESFAMGAYLSQPITKKEIGVEEDDNFWVSSTSMQGWRVSQEVSGRH